MSVTSFLTEFVRGATKCIMAMSVVAPTSISTCIVVPSAPERFLRPISSLTSLTDVRRSLPPSKTSPMKLSATRQQRQMETSHKHDEVIKIKDLPRSLIEGTKGYLFNLGLSIAKLWALAATTKDHSDKCVGNFLTMVYLWQVPLIILPLSLLRPSLSHILF